jgi:hypothetical protein
MECLEYCRFQEIKTLAVAENRLSLEEGTTIYGFLGESVETFNTQPLPVKIALTTLFKYLLEGRIKVRSGPSESWMASAPSPPKRLVKKSVAAPEKHGFTPALIAAIRAWVDEDALDLKSEFRSKDIERVVFNRVLKFKRDYHLAWWDVERVVFYAIEAGLNLAEPTVLATVVEQLQIRPEDTQTLPLFKKGRMRH